MIPKMIHMCYHWQPIPSWAMENISEFALMNPSYRMVVWDKLPRDLPPEILEAIEWPNSHRFASDLVRYWILHAYGGVYVDIDCRPIRPFDEDLLGHQLFLSRYDSLPRADNFFMGAVPGACGLKAAIERCLDPSTWHMPQVWFGTTNIFMDRDGRVRDGVELLDAGAAINARNPARWQELLQEPRPTIDHPTAYLIHYCVHGQRERFADINGWSFHPSDVEKFEPDIQQVIYNEMPEWRQTQFRELMGERG